MQMEIKCQYQILTSVYGILEKKIMHHPQLGILHLSQVGVRLLANQIIVNFCFIYYFILHLFIYLTEENG